MSEPLPILMEKAIQIAWDYLERTGELGDPEEASKFLLNRVEAMIRRGESAGAVEQGHRRLPASESGMNPNCPSCFGLGWVCENHPRLPWTGDGKGCQCGAGMPCECNRADGLRRAQHEQNYRAIAHAENPIRAAMPTVRERFYPFSRPLDNYGDTPI
jgi:hypothetical protein